MEIRYFVLNHPPNIERLNNITLTLKRENIDFMIVNRFGPDEIDYDKLTDTNYEIHKGIVIEQTDRYSYYNNPNKVPKHSISLILKHMYCWQKQIELDLDWGVIFEDDSEIPIGFSSILQNVFIELSKNQYDLVMLGTFLDFESPDKSNNLLKYDYRHKTRCTHAYIISKNACQKMIDGFEFLNNSIDFKMNEVIQLQNLKVAWLEPGLKQI
jgi:GR25 family glycosyltransferase involved in LPS biosynthesis